MATTNQAAGTNVQEIAEGVYRINTPVDLVPGGFSFNQYLVVDDQPLLFHTGPRKMFSLVREAVESVIPVSDLRFIALSHFEADECGSINEWLAAAPASVPCAAGLRQWYQSTILRKDRPMQWPTVPSSCSESARSNGSMRRICRMAGKRAS